MSAPLEVVDLWQRHRAEGPAVLSGISLRVPAGEVAVVVGPSGAGKSTLLRCIAGLLAFDAGSIRLGQRTSSPERPEGLLGMVGLVFQGFELFPHLTVRENCLLGPRLVHRLPRPEGRARVDGLLEKLELRALADAFPATLSGGQRQRVAIARALAMEPLALLWDEPTSALDASLRQSVAALIRGVSATAIPQLVVTHDPEVARAVGGRIYRFVDGGLCE